MDSFRKDGHLTDAALEALIRGDTPDTLERLEISEHLAYCDLCLQRYADLLAGTELLTPEHSCREPLLRRIRIQAIRLLTSRYATAAAAVVLALTLLWSEQPSPSNPVWEKAETITQTAQNWPEQYSAALDRLSDDLRSLFDRITPRPSTEKETPPHEET